MLTQLTDWLAKSLRRRTYPPCFHCGEALIHPLQQEFAGQARLVCCHGCASVLQAIEQAGQSAAYLAEQAGRGEKP